MLQKPEELLQKSKTYKENVRKNHSRVFGLRKNPEKWKPSNLATWHHSLKSYLRIKIYQNCEGTFEESDDIKENCEEEIILTRAIICVLFAVMLQLCVLVFIEQSCCTAEPHGDLNNRNLLEVRAE